ncbi:MAG: hypothetical protein ACT4P6_06530, partial [Gemmatimonadaceae bacterium]
MKSIRCARWRHAFAGALFLTTAGAIPAWAQGTTVSGRVRSEQGQNLQAANVFITELSISTGTNE